MNRTLTLILALSFYGFSFAQDWKQMSSLPDTALGRNHAVTFSLDGYGYMGTGYHVEDTNGYLFSDFYRYDPVEDTWEGIKAFPGGDRGFAYGVTSGNQAYVGFGLTQVYDDVRKAWVNEYLKDLWRFDPIGEEWTKLADCECVGRYHPAMVATDDKIFIGLGSSARGDVNDWWEYDIASNSWSQKPNFPGVRRHHPYYFSIDSMVYVGFGHGRLIYKDFYSYNPRTEEWKAIAQFPGEGRVAGAQFSHGGLGYVISGQGEDHRNLETGEFFSYDPVEDKWTQLPAHPGKGRWAPATFVINDKLYFGTGLDGIEHKDLWVYDLPPTSSVGLENINAPKLGVYPNPSEGSFYFSDQLNGEEVEVYSTIGSLVRTAVVMDNKVDLSELGAGTYFLKVHRSNNLQIERVVIK